MVLYECGKLTSDRRCHVGYDNLIVFGRKAPSDNVHKDALTTINNSSNDDVMMIVNANARKACVEPGNMVPAHEHNGKWTLS